MSEAVGYRAVSVPDPELNLAIPVAVFYPTDAPAQPETIGPYQVEVARDAPVRPGRWPLVLLSHGTGSSGLVHRNLALFLARQGFVVGLPEHPRNNRDDDSWANTPQNLQARPRHLQLVLDYLLADAHLAPALRPDSVALIGHSLGGYTALALAGGRPHSVPYHAVGRPPQRMQVPATDARVRALVLLAGELDPFTPPAHVEMVRRGVPDAELIHYRVVPDAGHFSFLSPFPAARVSPQFPPSQDPPGFDRARFHEQELYPEILAFLRRFTA